MEENPEQKKCCRTCLASLSEEGFVDLNTVIEPSEFGLDKAKELKGLSEAEDKAVTYLECLNNCLLHFTQPKNVDTLPMQICMKCSVTLQLVNNFIEKAKRAQEALTACETTPRFQEKELQLTPPQTSSEYDDSGHIDIKLEALDDEEEFISDPQPANAPTPTMTAMNDGNVKNFLAKSILQSSDFAKKPQSFLKRKVGVDFDTEVRPSSIQATTNTKIIIRRFYNTTCKICNLAFETKHRLNAHMKMAHKNDSIDVKRRLIIEVKRHKLLYQRVELDEEVEIVCAQRAKALNLSAAEVKKHKLHLARDYMWESIATKLKLSPVETKTTWQQLRGQYFAWKNRLETQPNARFAYSHELGFLSK